MGANLRERQILTIREMLNLNVKDSNSSNAIGSNNKLSGMGTGGEPIWKILVYDRVGQDILTPLMSVQDLRSAGVTLHVLLHSERESIPDVPAIYFCLPTEENVERMSRDVQNTLYDMYYLNFITPIPRSRIEDLATASWQANVPTAIQKVYDQYLNFISLESDFFVLKQHHNADNISFYAMNRAAVQDTEMEAILDSIVDSLFSVFSTLGVVPIIRCSKGNAAEHVGEKLDKKIRDNLRDPRNSPFMNDPLTSGYGLQRPLLILFDRTLDLSTPLHHTWTYQALAHDVLDLKLNQLTYMDSDGPVPGSSKPKTYDLNESRDFFWASYRGTPFPTTAEAIQTELEDYKKAEEEVKRLKGEMGLDLSSDNITEIGSDMLNDNTARLTSAISNLPQLLEKKRILDAHTGIATAILKQIKQRKLDSFFEYESKLINRTALDRGVLDILLDPELGDPEDKMRFFLLYYLQQDMSKSELEQFTSALQSSGCDLNPIDFVKKWISYTKMSSQFQMSMTAPATNKSMLSKLVTGSSFLMEGVRNLVVKRQTLPLTRMTEELMDGTRTANEEFLYFDPKVWKSNSAHIAPSKSQHAGGSGGGSGSSGTFNEAFVFVIGGGNYIEYQNLQDFVKSKSQSTAGGVTKRITYGCTTLCNASQFLKQLSKLGEEMK